MGSKEYEASSSFSLIAAIKATDLVPSTSSSSTAYGPHNGAYWYFYSGYSIGFAAASNINLFKADYADPDYSDCATRLSWHLNDQGGWRSGCTINLWENDYFRKYVYVCQGVAGVSCTNCPAGKSSPSGSTSSTACINCLAGKYSTAGSLCTNCEAGKYTKMPTLRCGGRNCGTGCTPSDGMFSGTISDGPGDYGDNADCQWLLTANSEIRISFSSFYTERDYDFVKIFSCTSDSCVQKTQIFAHSGTHDSPIYPDFFNAEYTSTTGFLQMTFTSDGGLTLPGFEAKWSILGSAACTACLAGTYSGAADTVCTPCAAGKFSALEGQTSAAACTSCPAGKSSPSGSTSSTACINCLAGTYSLAGSSCTNCEAGKYKRAPIDPTLQCGGTNCQSDCRPSTGVFSGTISDGAGNYMNYEDCWWLLTTGRGIEIQISFNSFNTEQGYDFVNIFQ